MVNGLPGWDGYYLSAYGIAVKHGFRGSEEEWLASLGLPAREAAELANEAAGKAAAAMETLNTQGNAALEALQQAAETGTQNLNDIAANAQNDFEASLDQFDSDFSGKIQEIEGEFNSWFTSTKASAQAAVNQCSGAQSSLNAALAQINTEFTTWLNGVKADLQTQIGLSIKLTTDNIKDGQAVSYADGTLLLVYKDALSAMNNGG